MIGQNTNFRIQSKDIDFHTNGIPKKKTKTIKVNKCNANIFLKKYESLLGHKTLTKLKYFLVNLVGL